VDAWCWRFVDCRGVEGDRAFLGMTIAKKNRVRDEIPSRFEHHQGEAGQRCGVLFTKNFQPSILLPSTILKQGTPPEKRRSLHKTAKQKCTINSIFKQYQKKYLIETVGI